MTHRYLSAQNADDQFQELADGLLWGPEDRAVALYGYFDESGSSKDPNTHCFVIAGCVAETQNWSAFDERWSAILGSEALNGFIGKIGDMAIKRLRAGVEIGVRRLCRNWSKSSRGALRP